MIVTDRFNQVWEIVKQGSRWVASNGTKYIPASSKEQLLKEIAA